MCSCRVWPTTFGGKGSLALMYLEMSARRVRNKRDMSKSSHRELTVQSLQREGVQGKQTEQSSFFLTLAYHSATPTRQRNGPGLADDRRGCFGVQ